MLKKLNKKIVAIGILLIVSMLFTWNFSFMTVPYSYQHPDRTLLVHSWTGMKLVDTPMDMCQTLLKKSESDCLGDYSQHTNYFINESFVIWSTSSEVNGKTLYRMYYMWFIILILILVLPLRKMWSYVYESFTLGTAFIVTEGMSVGGEVVVFDKDSFHFQGTNKSYNKQDILKVGIIRRMSIRLINALIFTFILIPFTHSLLATPYIRNTSSGDALTYLTYIMIAISFVVLVSVFRKRYDTYIRFTDNEYILVRLPKFEMRCVRHMMKNNDRNICGEKDE